LTVPDAGGAGSRDARPDDTNTGGPGDEDTGTGAPQDEETDLAVTLPESGDTVMIVEDADGACESPRETTGTIEGESAYAENNTTGTTDGWRIDCPQPAAAEIESQEEYAARECS
jgi:hypothetical protein